MKEKLSHIKLPHIIIFSGCIIAIFAILSFLGQGIKLVYDGETIGYEYSSVFNFMFGTGDAYKIPGLVFVFVFELFVIFLSLTLITLTITKVIDKKFINIISIVICVLLLVAFILILCTKSFVLSKAIEKVKENVPFFVEEAIEFVNKLFSYVHISTGPIVYTIMSVVSILLISIGLVLLNLKDLKKIRVK